MEWNAREKKKKIIVSCWPNESNFHLFQQAGGINFDSKTRAKPITQDFWIKLEMPMT